jgi:hypothetical protein
MLLLPCCTHPFRLRYPFTDIQSFNDPSCQGFHTQGEHQLINKPLLRFCNYRALIFPTVASLLKYSIVINIISSAVYTIKSQYYKILLRNSKLFPKEKSTFHKNMNFHLIFSWLLLQHALVFIMASNSAIFGTASLH